MALFVLFAAMQRNTLAGFVDPNEGEAEFRLACIPLAIQGNQRPPHDPGQRRADQGISEGAPDHVAGNRYVMARHLERDLCRQGPGSKNRQHSPSTLGTHTCEQGQVADKIEVLRWCGFDPCVR